MKEGGSSSKNNNAGDTAQRGEHDGGGSAAGVGGMVDDREMAAVPWGTSALPPRPTESAPRPGGDGSLVSPPEQRRKNAYAAVLGGAGSPRLPEELAASSWDRGDAGDQDIDGDEAAPAFAEGWGMGAAVPPPVPPPPPREEMAPAEVLRVVARGVRAEFKTLQWACRQVSPSGNYYCNSVASRHRSCEGG